MFKAMRECVGRFGKDTSGHVAIIAGLALIPIISVAGVAIDLQLTTTKKNKVQHVVDSAVLAGSKSMQAGKSRKEIRKDVRRYIKGLIKTEGEGLSCDKAKLVFSDDSEDLVVSVRCFQDTTLSSILGKDNLEFNVSSTSTYGIGKVDVAFIFDNSGSMNSNNRLNNLKTSARSAVDILLPIDWQTNEDVRIGIVPYNASLNAGEFFDDVTTSIRRFNLEAPSVLASIYSSQIIGKVQLDAFNSNERFFDYEKVTCTAYYRRWGRTYCAAHTTTSARKEFDSTCVFARTGDQRYTNAEPNELLNDAINASSPLWDYYDRRSDKISGQNEIENGGANNSRGAFRTGYNNCPSTPVKPLTNNRTELYNTINGMTAGGGTAGHLGLAWAYYMISPEWNDIWPNSANALSWNEPDTIKAIILMTDGEFNSSHPATGVNSTTQSARICDEIKANSNKNIVIYTIGFQVPENVTKVDGKTILQYCASKPEYAFDASSAQELTDAYEAIASSISDLRIRQ